MVLHVFRGRISLSKHKLVTPTFYGYDARLDEDNLKKCNYRYTKNHGFFFSFFFSGTLYSKISNIFQTIIICDFFIFFSFLQELKGGKSYLKLGYADVNLSSLAGQGLTKCRCLLEAYNGSKSSHRQDNSLLHFTLDIKLVAGDPCFKT